MKIKKIIIFILTLLLAVVLAYFSFDTVTQVEQPDKTKLNVHFIDVGQADCMLITTPDDKTMLIDAGNNADGDDVVNYIKKQGIDTIDVLIGTHPHEDHIGGMDDVIKNFNIGKFYMPRAANNTKTFEDVLDAAQEKGLKITAGKAGMNIGLSDSVNAEILAPNSETYKDLNNYSIVVKLTYKQDSFLFMGDAEKQSENEILDKGYDISTDVLKIGHVICVGKGNDYGHPHKETMKLLKDYGLTVYRTDECGTIIATSDGNGITFNVKPGDYKYHSK